MKSKPGIFIFVLIFRQFSISSPRVKYALANMFLELAFNELHVPL